MYTWHETTTVHAARPRRRNFAVLAAGAVFAIAALSASGQSLHITLTEPPSVLEAGTTWQANLKVQRAGKPVADARPEIVFIDQSGVRHVFPAQPDSRRGTYRVKITLPDGGRWTYEVRLGDDVVRRGQIKAKPPLPAA